MVFSILPKKYLILFKYLIHNIINIKLRFSIFINYLIIKHIIVCIIFDNIL